MHASIQLDAVKFSHPGDGQVSYDANIAASDIVAIMGPSGAGKTTLLNLISGFEKPSSGRVIIGGKDMTSLLPHQRPVSMIFQENNLFAHLTVAQNVGLGRSPSLRLSAADHAAIEAALVKTGLSGKEDRLPNALSGGERQRVALARVLVRQSAVLLLDEPLASLGPALRDEMLDLIAELHAEAKMTILMVTHDPRDAQRLAKSLLFIDEGHIAATGTTEEMFSANGSEAFSRYLGNRSMM